MRFTRQSLLPVDSNPGNTTATFVALNGVILGTSVCLPVGFTPCGWSN